LTLKQKVLLAVVLDFVKFVMEVVGEQRENCLVVDYGCQYSEYYVTYEFQSGVFKVKWKAQAGKRKI
jgi:hypothetical protein